MNINNFAIERESMNREEIKMFHLVRKQDAIKKLYSLWHDLTESIGRNPTQDEYMKEYLKEWRLFLRENDVKERDNKYGKVYNINHYQQLKPFIEERAYKAYRSFNVEEQVENILKEMYKDAKVITHRNIDMAMGVDIVLEIENKKKERVYLYIHVMDVNTKKESIAKKKEKTIPIMDKFNKVHFYKRDFSSKSHCYFCYDGKNHSGLIDVKEEEVREFVEKELKRSEEEQFDTVTRKGTFDKIIKFQKKLNLANQKGA